VNTSARVELEKPSDANVKERIAEFAKGGAEMDATLNWLFRDRFPENTDLNQVLVKCTVLNNFYHAGVRDKDLVSVAKCIVSLKIDNQLKQGDEGLVERISSALKGCTKSVRRGYFTFVTKYCSFHNPEAFPIYDTYVSDMLWDYSQKDSFTELTHKYDMDMNYPRIKQVIEDFRKYYKLEKFSFKQIDEYLWQTEKDLREAKHG